MTVADIQRMHAAYHDQINSRGCTSISIPPELQINHSQLGFGYALVDQLGRIWAQQPDGHTLKMIFDPMWLHPSKRWCGPTEVPRNG